MLVCQACVCGMPSRMACQIYFLPEQSEIVFATIAQFWWHQLYEAVVLCCGQWPCKHLMATTDVGSDTASAVDVSWATPTSTSHVVPPDSEFGKRVVKEFVPMVKGTFRSPAIYLREKLDSPEKQQVFADVLFANAAREG